MPDECYFEGDSIMYGHSWYIKLEKTLWHHTFINHSHDAKNFDLYDSSSSVNLVTDLTYI